MRAHIIKNGIVANTIEVESLDFMPGLIEATEGGIGDLWDGQTFSKPSADPAQLKDAASAAIQNLLDTTAHAHGYDSLERCISYIGDGVAAWSAEGARAKAWRSECWSKAKQIQDDATAGNWPTAGAAQLPTVADVLAAMPAANWPPA